MRKTIRKGFWVWNFDKEEKWLNEMAAKGLHLVSVGFCSYEFEEGTPGDYKICLELLKHRPGHPESAQYLRFLEETGVEHVGSFMKWVYLRKRTDGDFAIYSDNESRVKYLTGVMRFILIVLLFNLYAGSFNLYMFFAWHSEINIIGFLSILICLLGTFGLAKLYKKRKKLKAEQQLFE